MVVFVWPGNIMVRVSDLQYRGHRFQLLAIPFLCYDSGQVVHAQCASDSDARQYDLVPTKVR